MKLGIDINDCLDIKENLIVSDELVVGIHLIGKNMQTQT